MGCFSGSWRHSSFCICGLSGCHFCTGKFRTTIKRFNHKTEGTATLVFDIGWRRYIWVDTKGSEIRSLYLWIKTHIFPRNAPPSKGSRSRWHQNGLVSAMKVNIKGYQKWVSFSRKELYRCYKTENGGQSSSDCAVVVNFVQTNFQMTREEKHSFESVAFKMIIWLGLLVQST